MSNSPEIGKRNHHRHSSQSEDEEESLSLCDLPLLRTTSDQEGDDGEQREIGDQQDGKNATSEARNGEVSEDFDFGSLVASLDAMETEMCAADEVFYRGQILPFRHSVSSASAAGIRSSLARSVSRSASMDRIVGSGFQSSSTASSSRSSSTRSSSINSSASASKLSQSHAVNYSTNSNHKRSIKVRNQFHSFPSPRPYARATSGPRTSISSAPSPSKKSALWEFFRLGIVRTPEIELEDLKFRYSKHQSHGRGASDIVITRTGSSGGSSCDSRSSGNGKSVNNHSFPAALKNLEKKKRERRKQKTCEKKGGMNLMNSCKCSIRAVEPEKAGSGRAIVVNNRHESAREEREKQQRMVVEKEKQEKQRKQDISRHHRTFEWLKDLSHAVVLNNV